MVAYNLIFDWLAVPLNMMIIIKEISMEFFQVLKHNAGTEGDDVSIGLMDIADMVITVGFFLNPFNMLTFIWQFLMGRVDLGEIGGENPGEDEKSYYKNGTYGT